MDSRTPPAVRVLSVTTIDLTMGKLLAGLLAALRAEGYRIEGACADGPYAARLRAEGFVIHPIAFTRRVVSVRHPVAFAQLLRVMRRGRYHIVHVHTPIAQVLGRIAARLAGVPLIIYTSHGFQFHQSRPRWMRWAILQMERWLGRWATDLLFTQSAEDAQTATDLHIVPADRVVWIGNGVEVERFGPDRVLTTGRAALGLRERDRVIGFVGRVVREKGVVELIEAMAQVRAAVPEARLLIIGDTLASDTDAAAKAAIRHRIALHGLEHAVIFTGFRDDVAAMLPLLDIFVLPSWREGMPRTILEAMASGLPVVATNIRGCREEVIDGETGLLVPPRDPATLADALIRLLSQPTLARQLGTAGRRRAFEVYDERLVIARQLQAYRAGLQTRGVTPPLPRQPVAAAE
jgi:glycosyltransferase involved in cell wall biosynthesis